ncbi:hypothetical protein AK812_SmicGene4533 [Symbiodinium microadriaticum]|uniref:Integrase catalytic domain-containing protein n=1 Tax=Symbiodinium microadriaticum TaxID=2951 RepID=A0A1Q9EW01_SYMMI|nr:hypothetical protein AK812_SmicGene4533 [Symbiodinium microadriaticum]
MATPSSTVDPEVAEILVAAAKAKAATKRRPRSLDTNRCMRADPRDPRTNPKCWPCYGNHSAGAPQSNAHGQWIHCSACHLRMLYTPRKGSPSNTTAVLNAAMVTKMLKQLKALIGDRKPTAKICHHMQAKITAEEVLEKSIRELLVDVPVAPRATSSTTPTTEGYINVTTKDNDEELIAAYEAEVMLFVSLMTTATSNLLMGIQLDGRDGLWEISGAPHSWLSQAADQYGLQARPINYQTGYDLYKEETWNQLRRLRHLRQPRRVWFSLPCSKWCPWKAIDSADLPQRESPEAARRKEGRALRLAVNFVKETLEEDPDVQIYWEWPSNSAGWSQHAMLELQEWFGSGEFPWLSCRIDGCAYGLKDEQQGFAPRCVLDFIRTLIFKVWNTRRPHLCDINNFFTYDMICQLYVMEMILDHHSNMMNYNFMKLPWSLMARRIPLYKRLFFMNKSEFKLNTLLERLGCGSSSTLQIVKEYCMHYNKFFNNDLRRVHNITYKNPELFQTWVSKVAKFHRAAGHPTNRNLAHIVSDGGHPKWKVQVALGHRCPACEANKQGSVSSGQVPPASTSPMYRAWQAVTIDAAEWPIPGTKQKMKFILFMDFATKFRIVAPIKVYDIMAMDAESADAVIHAFSERWLSVFPKPKIAIMDSAKTFTSLKMHEFLSSVNIAPHFIAEKEHWSHGVAEAAVQDVKSTATAIQMEALDQEPAVTLHLAAAALNSTEYTAGFSSYQWVFGQNYNITDEDYRTFASLPRSQQQDFTALVTARQHGKRGQDELCPSWPTLRFANLYENSRSPRGGSKKSGRPHWIGPGRVVFHEVLPQQQEGDQRRHIVWVLIGSQLYRCSVHSVRHATETEKFMYETMGTEDVSRWKTLADILPKREYHDVVNEEPGEEEVELPDLPQQPDPTTVQVPLRRVRQKTTFKPGEWTDDPVRDRLQVEPEAVNDYVDDLPGRQPATSSTTTPSHQIPVEEAPVSKRAKTGLEDLAATEWTKTTWVEELYMQAAIEEKEMDIFTAFEETHDFLKIEFDIGPITSNRQQKMLINNPQAFLVKKMKDSEVVLTKLPPHERQLFARAKTKEVGSFLSNEAVRRCLSDSEIKEAFDTQRIVKARWVLTWKLVPPEDHEEALRDARGNPDTLHDKAGRRKAKARIILLGFQHPNLLDRNFNKTSAPVQSLLGRNLLYQMSAQHQWPLEGLDLATAFLQTQPTEADAKLWTTGVQELRDALQVGEEGIMRILRNIYGSTTAPRGLWLDLHKTLTSLGGHPVLAERCLWIWKSKDVMDGSHPKVIGAMGGHVDDFHRIGDKSDEWNEIKNKVDNAYKWGTAKKGNYRHAGTDVTTIVKSDGEFYIEVDQSYYAEGIPDLEISPERLREDGPLRSQEVAACRTTLGALQWLGFQTQPQLCARCNLLLTEIVVQGALSHAREIQEMLGEVRRGCTKLRFFRLPTAHHWSELVFVSMGDQAHCNRPRGGSTGGMVTLIAGPESLLGQVCPMTLIAWRTWKLQRKAVGSNDAEVQSILEAEDQNFRSRLLWTELHGAHETTDGRENLVAASERQALQIREVLCTDSRGGYDAVEVNESPLLGLSNLRSALQAFQLRDNLKRVRCELRWVASDYDLGDALTKKKAEARIGLLKFLNTWHWSIAFDKNFVSAKKSKQQGKTAVGSIDDFLKGNQVK